MLNEAPANRLLVYLSRQTECRENLFVWLHEKDENMSKHYFAGACIRSLYATQLPAVAIIIYSYLFICSVPLMLLDEFVAELQSCCCEMYVCNFTLRLFHHEETRSGMSLIRADPKTNCTFFINELLQNTVCM